MKLKAFTLLIILIKEALSKLSNPCLPASTCQDNVKCSENGHCFYDILQYIKYYNKTINATQSFVTCVCDSGWTNLQGSDDVKCCYQQRSQTVAFLCEFLVGFGLGHFYIGNITLGSIKLIIFTTACCAYCTIGFCFCYKEDNENEVGFKQKLLNVLFLISLCTFLLWQIVDSVLFGLNIYQDSNKIDLVHW